MLSTTAVAPLFVCPTCRGNLAWETGQLTCPACRKSYRYERGVWQFLESEGYTASFGFQWKKFSRTQLDKFNGLTISRERFERETDWSTADLKGKRLLEIGSGPGRFTEVALNKGAEVFSLEPSEAVFVNAANNDHDHLCLLQASLYEQPFAGEIFDYLLCFGVIQHTPDVRKSFACLFRHLKKGGRFAIDVYAAPHGFLHPRHLIRPFTRKMDPQELFERVERWVKRLWPLSHALNQVPLIGEGLARFVPIANFERSLTFKTREQMLEWSLLDTYDWYSPRYEKPQWRSTMERWCRELKLAEFTFRWHRGLLCVTGSK